MWRERWRKSECGMCVKVCVWVYSYESEREGEGESLRV
jgi:hypothetical protein